MTDDERICKKFEITRDDPWFETAKALDRSRPDRVICELPAMMCPNCGHEFTATYADIDPANGDEMPCPECECSIFVEHIQEPEDVDPCDGGDHTVVVTLCTHPKEADT